MRDLYSDDYDSLTDAPAVSPTLRRLAAAALFLTLITTLTLWSYRLGTRDAAEVPIIRAMEGAARIEPDDPGGSQAAHQGLEVNAVLAAAPVPVPAGDEAVMPVARVLTQEDSSQGELVLSAPQALAERLLGQAPARDQALGTPQETDDFLPVPLAEVAEADAIVGADDADAGAMPGPRPRNRPSNLVVARAEPEKKPVAPAATVVAAVASAAAPVARTAVAVQPAADPGKGARLVQLGAFDSEAITRAAWDQLVARNPDLLASKSLYVERTTSNARVFYRLRVAGFDSSDQTRQMCEALRSRGIDCIPVTLQ
jgi:cell division septation protein DedD